MRESHALEQRLKRSRYAAIMADRVLFSRVFAQSLVTKPTKKKKKKKKRYVSAVNSVRSRENATLECSQESSGHSASMSFTHHNPSNSSVSAIQNCNSTNTTSIELNKQQQSLTESSSNITRLRSNIQQSSSSSLAQSSADNESNADNVNQIHDRTSDELSVTSSSTTPLTTTPSDKHSSGAHSCDDATENDLDLSLYGRGKRVSKPKRIDDLDEMEAINVVKKTVRKRGRPPKDGIRYVDKSEKQKCEENGYLNVRESGKKFDGNNQSNIPFKKRKFRTDSSAEIAVNAEKCVEKKKPLIDDSDKRCDEQNKCEIVEEDNRMPSTSDQQSVPASLNMEENQTNE
ncbi:unnamed protein product, partial [Anisakis simplex]|uniref:Suppressor protein SRP40-like n=1 Tax=Anisakis simplex TaxID=6269 RepID=A0A0M3JD86_ANISI